MKTREEYAAYQARVSTFLTENRLHSFNCKPDCAACNGGNFSWTPCPVCRRSHSAGDRHEVNAYQAQREIVVEFLACTDCVYYAEYGRLDDETMMGLDDDGCDECIECHRRFNATEADKRPICPKCA